ncbi:hypothetical protein BOX15_Mlig031485g1 [Macrostomum lignano]|uniref:Uncharacterized protein n=2 Tax=Macrostomum lignano TaxID=282301 RepID=A0A267DE64_9PLAT|nr:hypothetical protein BOX15_Mlig031485g3 [Macrostomum lignano]PAA53203.1 hypothetical protein BOX15_Mlig031485g2 [Macrostomum lignano]PAA89491.1 hypothetical protein BOX15_Mlig031485g1 [Macrostomum lignano]
MAAEWSLPAKGPVLTITLLMFVTLLDSAIAEANSCKTEDAKIIKEMQRLLERELPLGILFLLPGIAFAMVTLYCFTYLAIYIRGPLLHPEFDSQFPTHLR